MSRVTLNDAYLTATADAIRAKTGESGTLTPAQFATAIGSISGGGSTIGIFNIHIFEDINPSLDESGTFSIDLSGETVIAALCYFEEMLHGNSLWAGGGSYDFSGIASSSSFHLCGGNDFMFDDADRYGLLVINLRTGIFTWENAMPHELLVITTSFY